MTPVEIRFAADGMLQSLATWLRLLGYDCIASPDQFGRRLLEQAVKDDRVFLTRNTHLADNLPQSLLERALIVSIDGERVSDQLRQVVGAYSLETGRYVFTRCVECNEPLCRAARSEAIGCVPSDVAERETEFWWCRRCGKMFWRGTHVKNSLERLQQWLAPSAGSAT